MLRQLFTSSLISAAALLLLNGCKARKDFPEPEVGWHSPSYSVVYGTIRRVAPEVAGNPPTWVIVFGSQNGPYEGMLALTPPRKANRL